MSFQGVLGSSLIRAGAAAPAGLMGAIVGTQTANLLAAYAVGEDLATAKNNPGLADASGNGRTATHLATGSPSFDGWFTYQQGPQDGIENFIQGNSARYGWLSPLPSGLPAAWTMLAFVNNTANAGYAVSMCDLNPSAAGRGFVVLRLFDSGALLLDSFNDSGTRSTMASIAGQLLNDKWTMVAATYAGGTAQQLYVDGANVTSGTLNAIASPLSADRMCGGAASSNASNFQGSIDGDLGPYAFWDSVLTDSEIAAIFAASGL